MLKTSNLWEVNAGFPVRPSRLLHIGRGIALRYASISGSFRRKQTNRGTFSLHRVTIKRASNSKPLETKARGGREHVFMYERERESESKPYQCNRKQQEIEHPDVSQCLLRWWSQPITLGRKSIEIYCNFPQLLHKSINPYYNPCAYVEAPGSRQGGWCLMFQCLCISEILHSVKDTFQSFQEFSEESQRNHQVRGSLGKQKWLFLFDTFSFNMVNYLQQRYKWKAFTQYLLWSALPRPISCIGGWATVDNASIVNHVAHHQVGNTLLNGQASHLQCCNQKLETWAFICSLSLYSRTSYLYTKCRFLRYWTIYVLMMLLCYLGLDIIYTD